MKNSLVFIFLALSIALVAFNSQVTAFAVEDPDNGEETEYGLILNSQAKKAVQSVLDQLPCGFPEAGVPPLAPYTNSEMQMNFALSEGVKSFLEALRFRFDGLDDMDILSLKVSYTFGKSVKFDFNFPRLRATAPFLNSDSLVDFLEQLGVSVRYEGSGPLDFTVENLRLTGQFKYKMPILWGSIKIYKFQMAVTLGGVRSSIGGIMGNSKFNRWINDKIEVMLPAFINGNQEKISEQIEKILVPSINESLKGNNVLSLLWKSLLSIGSGSSPPCVPTPAPWSA